MDPFAITEPTRNGKSATPLLHGIYSALIWGSAQWIHREKRKASVFFGGLITTVLYTHDFFQQGAVFSVMSSHFGPFLYSTFFGFFVLMSLALWAYNVMDAYRMASFLEMVSWRTIALEADVPGWDFSREKEIPARTFGPITILIYAGAIAAILHFFFSGALSSRDSLLNKVESNPSDFSARKSLIEFYLETNRSQHARLEADEYLQKYAGGLSALQKEYLYGVLGTPVPASNNANPSVVLDFVIDGVMETKNVNWSDLKRELPESEFERRVLEAIQENKEDLKPAEILLNHYMENSEWDRAHTLASDLLRHHPHVAWLMQTMLLAERRLKQSNVEQKPDFGSAIVLYREGELEKAEVELNHYFEAGGQDKEAFLLQNAISFQQKDYKEAIKHLEAALKVYPEDFLFLYSLGNAWLRQEQYQNAIPWFEKILEFDTGRKDVYKNLGLAYRKTNNSARSIHNYRKALALDPEDESLLFLLGFAEFEAEEFDSGAKSLTQLMQVNPSHPLAAFYLGQIYEKLNEFEEAINAYQAVPTTSSFHPQAQDKITALKKRLTPTPTPVIRQTAPIIKPVEISKTNTIDSVAQNLELAEKSWKNDNKADAIRWYRKVLEFDPMHFRSLSQIGRHYLEDLSEYKEAQEYLLKARQIKSDDIWVNLSLGIISKYMNNTFEAVRYFEDVLKKEPTQLNANFNLALLYEDRNQLDLAKEYYSRVIRFHPRHQLAYNYLGDISFNEGDYSKASEIYRGLLQISPDNTSIRFKLALSLEKEGNLVLAREELNKLSSMVASEPLMASEVLAALQRVSNSRP